MKPHLKDFAGEAAEYAAKWSGGDESEWLVEVEAFAKTLKVGREPEDGQLGLLASAQLKRTPRWPTACLKALLQAPECFCRRKGEASMFTGSDIKLMETTLQPKIKEATELMDKARAWYVSDMQSQPAVAQRITGDFEVRLVMHVTGLSKKLRPGSYSRTWRRSPANSPKM